MTEVADLELSLKRRSVAGGVADGDLAVDQAAAQAPGQADAAGAPGNPNRFTYAVEMRFSRPGDDADIRVGVDEPVSVCFDFDQLRSASGDADAYANALTSALFADANFSAEFGKARVATESAGQALRMRLLIDYAAPELLNLRWESLRDPEKPTDPLFTGEKAYFSRFLVSRDWRPVQLSPKGDLRALIAVANPSDLDAYKLAAIDVPTEIMRAKTGLSGALATTLPAEGANEYCTLNRLVDTLRAGGPDGAGYDILFLVCHGAYIRGEPILLMEDDSGKAARVPGTDLIARISELNKIPRLVVLASCQSAGISAGQAFTALGPRLAEAGVPAVVAMQGSVSMPTMDGFLPRFFAELMNDGVIDRAMAVARGVVRTQPDFWMPVLFMRLKSGRLWYTPGFSSGDSGFKEGDWETLVGKLTYGTCTPLIGSGITESLLGSSSQMVSRWAEDSRFPLEKHESSQLPQVAQFVATQQNDRTAPRMKWTKLVRLQVLERYGSIIPPDLKMDPRKLDAMLEIARQARVKEMAAQGKMEPYQFLAKQNFKIYITTDFSNLLASALAAEGKTPRVAMCPWNSDVEDKTAMDDVDSFSPTEQNPLVYHLFGRYDFPPSLVLSEDDYFDFLVGVTKNKQLIPSYILNSLVSTSLLFFGFQLDEWNFRILYRSIMNQEGSSRRKNSASVGVQVDQESGDIGDPDSARRYLETYFKQTAFINLYWGNTEDFVQELIKKMSEQ